jgi:hypothetical protein
MAGQKDDNGIYKLIVIIGTGLFLLWGFATFQEKVSDYSKIIGFIIGPILMYLIYKIMKSIWPDLW